MSEQPTAALSRERIHLRQADIVHFGNLSHRSIGPLSPTLTVVLGKSESGKSSVAAFLAGVLFGWPQNQRGQELFQPKRHPREGTLIFEPYARLTRRGENAEIDGDVEILSEVDKEQFNRLMYWSETQLSNEQRAEDLTALLLASGGAADACSHALEQVQERIREFTSSSALSQHSLVRLEEERAVIRAQLERAQEKEQQLALASKEALNLKKECETLRARRDLEAQRLRLLGEGQETLRGLEDQEKRLQQEIERQRSIAREAEQRKEELAAEVGPTLSALTTAKDRGLRDRLEDLSAKEAKIARSLETAQNNVATSRTAYEVLSETRKSAEARRQERVTRAMQVSLSAVFPIAMLGVGVALFVFGRTEGSLSFALLGLALVVGAFLLAVGALLMAFGPSRNKDNYQARIDDALWVMRQDEKKLALIEEEKERFEQALTEEFQGCGLEAAKGSLRQARRVLDEAAEIRGAMAIEDQRLRAAELSLATWDAKLTELQTKRDEWLVRLKGERVTPALLEEETSAQQRRCTELDEAVGRLEQRWEEAKARLAEEPRDTNFDHLKQRLEIISTRLSDSRDEFEMLLLAEHFLQGALDTWRAATEPGIYEEAGRLLALMTDDRWTTLQVSETGELRVEGVERSSSLSGLSLGTRQLLALALRIAILKNRPALCPIAPVIVDDIFCGFDEARQLGLARALADLAQSRQVIVFTSQESLGNLLTSLEKTTAVIRLDEQDG